MIVKWREEAQISRCRECHCNPENPHKLPSCSHSCTQTFSMYEKPSSLHSLLSCTYSDGINPRRSHSLHWQRQETAAGSHSASMHPNAATDLVIKVYKGIASRGAFGVKASPLLSSQVTRWSVTIQSFLPPFFRVCNDYLLQ